MADESFEISDEMRAQIGKDRVGHVGCLRTCRTRLAAHRVQHLCRGDHRLARRVTLFDDFLLKDGDARGRELHAEVPARDHQPVRSVDDLVEVLDGLGTFDLGQHGH